MTKFSLVFTNKILAGRTALINYRLSEKGFGEFQASIFQFPILVIEISYLN